MGATYFLRMWLRPIDKVHFEILVTESPHDTATAQSRLPFDGCDDRRMTVLKALQATALQPNAYADDEIEWMAQAGLLDARRLSFHPQMRAIVGKELYRALCPPQSDVCTLLERSITTAQSAGQQLHVQIQIEADAARRARLADYPWELMHDDDGFLAHHQVTFSRYIAHDAAIATRPRVSSLNVLLISSDVGDERNGLEQLQPQEQSAVRTALERIQADRLIHIQALPRPTYEGLQRYLIAHPGATAPNVIHFDGHGVYGRRCTNPINGVECGTIHHGAAAEVCAHCQAPLPEAQGYVVFKDATGAADYVSAHDLGALLQNAGFGEGADHSGGIALVVLSACYSGLSLARDAIFSGVAQSLIQHQIPAVVAMQFKIGVRAATAFATAFYCALGQQESLALAVSRGRILMRPDSNEWYRPVLFLRWKDNEGGQLFSPAPRSGGEPSSLPRLVPADDLRNHLETAHRQIDVMDDYKTLHELLHSLQLDFYNPIREIEGRFPGDARARDDLRGHKETLKYIVRELKSEVARLANFDASMIPVLDQALEQLHTAIEEPCEELSAQQLHEVRRSIEYVLDRYHSPINTVLKTTANSLPLGAIEATAHSVREIAMDHGGDADEARRFDVATANLVDVNRRLTALVHEHDSWQVVETDLRAMEANLTQNASDLKWFWQRVKDRAEVLYADSTDTWAVELKQNSLDLQRAIDAQDTSMFKSYFVPYRRAAGLRFNRVDKDLKRLFSELLRAGGPLDALEKILS